MFIGHYAPAAALKAVSKGPPLWHYFVAVQVLDYLWAVFILTGVERGRVVPGFLAASPLDLYFMPYTHSLAAAVFWSLVAALAYGLVLKRGATPAAAIGAAVFSHWLADLLVHGEDLALYPGSEQKLGLGLWDSVVVSQSLETGLLVAGGFLYLSATRPKGAMGTISVAILAAAFAGAAAFNLTGPPPPNIESVAVLALVSYTLFAALAFLVDRSRTFR